MAMTITMTTPDVDQQSQQDDRVAVAGIRNSDPGALKVLFMRYSVPLHRFCCHWTGSADSADDVVQECFIRVWEHRDELDERRSIKSFIFQIANNLMIDQMRKTNVRRAYAERATDDSPSDSFAERFEMTDLMQSILRSVHPVSRSVFLLARVEGFDRREIAKMLDLSEKTVSNRLWDALTVLKKEIKKS
jgi:RNA polymerase sigma-70 factor (ECF subfamily)